MVALFFAVESGKETDCAVYTSYLFSGQLNPAATLNTLISKTVFAPIIPNFTQQRYANQQSLFTLHSDPTKFDASKISTRYLITNAVKKVIRWKLRMGISKSFIYPSLDSLSYDILEVHKLSYGDYFAKK